jgi:hypothetical protein
MNKVRPCSNCPFRTDKQFYLPRERRKEIAQSIGAKGEVFICHKQNTIPAAKRRPCVGSAMVLEREDLLLVNTAYRLHVLLNNFPANIEDDTPVYKNLKEFINA